MKLIELLLATLAEVSGRKLDEVAVLVKKADGSIDEEQSTFKADVVKTGVAEKLTAAKATVTTLSDAEKAAQFEEGRKKGKRQGAEAVEKTLVETFKVDAEGKEGEALVKHVAAKVTAAKGSKGELTKEEVEASPHFTAGLTAAKAKAEEEATRVKGELDKFKAGIETAKLHDAVWSEGEKIVEELGLNLSEDPARRKEQLAVIRRDVLVEGRGFRKEADGTVTVLEADGTPMKDHLQNLVPFKDLITRTATRYYDPLKGEKRTAPKVEGEKGEKGGAASEGKWTKEMPKNNDEFLKLAVDPNIPVAERIDLQTRWEAQGAAAAGATV